MVGILIILSQAFPIKYFDSKKIHYWLISTLVVGYLGVLCLMRNQTLKDAIGFWGNAVETYPTSPLGYRNLGGSYYMAKDYEKAKDAYLTLLDLNENEPNVHNIIGKIYMDRGDYLKAEEEFQKEIIVNPIYPAPYYNLGLLRFENEEFEEAEKMWLEAIRLYPEYIKAYERLVEMYSANNQLNKIDKIIKQAQSEGLLLNIK